VLDRDLSHRALRQAEDAAVEHVENDAGGGRRVGAARHQPDDGGATKVDTASLSRRRGPADQ